MTSDKLVKVAAIIGVHGIKGEVKLRSLVEDEDLLASDLLDSTGKRHFSIKVTGRTKDSIIAKIDGVTDRNAAEALKGTELFLPESEFPELDDGEVYHGQLIGLEARTKDGERIGTVTGISNYGAGDIIEITRDSGEAEMLPFAEPWIGEINLEEGFLIVTLADYM